MVYTAAITDNQHMYSIVLIGPWMASCCCQSWVGCGQSLPPLSLLHVAGTDLPTDSGGPSPPQEGPSPSKTTVKGGKCVCVCVCVCVCTISTNPILSWAVQCCVVALEHHLVAMSTANWTAWLDRLTPWTGGYRLASLCSTLPPSIVTQRYAQRTLSNT